MYSIITTLALLATLGLSAPVSAPTPTNCKPYIVQSGDSCYSIAQMGGMRPWEFMTLNPSISPDCASLQPGQEVCLDPTATPSTTAQTNPAAPPATMQPKATCGKSYIVKSGDYCYSIAQSRSITLPEFIMQNSGIDCKRIQPGQEVCVAGGVGGGGSTSVTSGGGWVKVVQTSGGSSTTPRKSTRVCPAESAKVGDSCRCYDRRLTYNVKSNICA